MLKVVNLEECFGRFSDTYSPKIVAELNGQTVMLVRAEGDKVPWHTHEREDEMFLVLEGTIELHERGRSVRLDAGELCVVKRGIEHRPVPMGRAKLLMFEPAGIAHTGAVRSEITKDHFDRLET